MIDYLAGMCITHSSTPGKHYTHNYGGWSVKAIHLGFVLVAVFLEACSTHFYTFDENKVTISLRNPEATAMFFASSLDGYEEQELKQRNGLWEVTLPNDKIFRYFFTVDGKIFLPPCPLKEKDDFGFENCIFEPKL